MLNKRNLKMENIEIFEEKEKSVEWLYIFFSWILMKLQSQPSLQQLNRELYRENMEFIVLCSLNAFVISHCVYFSVISLILYSVKPSNEHQAFWKQDLHWFGESWENSSTQASYNKQIVPKKMGNLAVQHDSVAGSLITWLEHISLESKTFVFISIFHIRMHDGTS